MQWPLRLPILLLAGALLLPSVLPVAADGDDDDRGRPGEGGAGPGDGDDEGAGPGDGDDEGEGSDDGSGDDGRDVDDGRGKDDRGGADRRMRHDDDDGDDEGDDGDHEDDDEGGHGGEGGRHDKGGEGDKGKGKDKGRDDGPDRSRDGDGETRVDPGPDGGGQAPIGGPHGEATERAGIRVSQDYDVAPGVLTFTFRVANDGQEPARDVQLDGDLPDVGQWVLADPLHCSLPADGGVDCDLGDLAGGEAVEVEVRGVLVGDVPAFTNVVQVYTPAADLARRPSSP